MGRPKPAKLPILTRHEGLRVDKLIHRSAEWNQNLNSDCRIRCRFRGSVNLINPTCPYIYIKNYFFIMEFLTLHATEPTFFHFFSFLLHSQFHLRSADIFSLSLSLSSNSHKNPNQLNSLSLALYFGWCFSSCSVSSLLRPLLSFILTKILTSTPLSVCLSLSLSHTHTHTQIQSMLAVSVLTLN